MPLKVRKNKSPEPPAPCPLTLGVKMLAGAWTPSIVWRLSGGARRFGELRADIREISPKMLTARLRDLETRGIVERSVLPTSPPSVEYSLTPLGEEMLPALAGIAALGAKMTFIDSDPNCVSRPVTTAQVEQTKLRPVTY